MLDESVADEKDSAACAQRNPGLRVAIGQGSETLIKTLEPSNRDGAVSLRKRLQRRVELRFNSELRRNSTKLNYFVSNGQRGEELGPLQRRGLVRQYHEPLSQSSATPATASVASRRTSRKVSSSSRCARNAGKSGGSSRNESAPAAQPTKTAGAKL